MLEQDLVARVKFSLSEPPGARSLEETLAAEELCRVCEPVIRPGYGGCLTLGMKSMTSCRTCGCLSYAGCRHGNSIPPSGRSRPG